MRTWNNIEHEKVLRAKKEKIRARKNRIRKEYSTQTSFNTNQSTVVSTATNPSNNHI